MIRNDYLISQARSNAGAQIHLVDNWVAAYVLVCESDFDAETASQAEALVQYVANLDKTPTRAMLIAQAKKLGL